MPAKFIDGPRYASMSIPGHLEDGSDTTWFLVDRKTRSQVRMGDGPRGLRRVTRELVKLNRRKRTGTT